jgi:putative transposase
MCRVLNVSRSGFFKWRNGQPSPRELENQGLLRKIEQVHLASRKSYGSPRVYRQLVALGHRVGRGRIERLMRQAGIRSRVKRRFRVTTDSRHKEPLAPDLVRRCFDVKEPNKVWTSDVTYLWTREGWLYLAVTLDLCSRRVVGWSMGEKLDAALVVRALEMACGRRHVKPGLIHHSDRGKEYASAPFRAALARRQMRQSMSRRANCWDNAVAESFFHTLKGELAESFSSRAEARRQVFEWLEVFYDRQRLHSSLGYVPPAVYEAKRHLAS